MKATLVTETKTYLNCPHCGERASVVDHILAGQPRSFGPWYCDECGRSYTGSLAADGTIDLELAAAVRTATLNLLTIPPRDEPVYLVVHGGRYGDDHNEGGTTAYYYDEHTCPTNWVSEVEAFILDGDSDPHGVAQFVRRVDTPPLPEGVADYDLPALFPEAFEGPVVDGEARDVTVKRLTA